MGVGRIAPVVKTLMSFFRSGVGGGEEGFLEPVKITWTFFNFSDFHDPWLRCDYINQIETKSQVTEE